MRPGLPRPGNGDMFFAVFFQVLCALSRLASQAEGEGE